MGRKPKPPGDEERKRRLPLSLAPWVVLGVMLAAWPRRLAPGDRGSALTALEPGRGRHASAPRAIPPAGWSDVLWRTWREAIDDNLLSVAGGVSFFTMLAVFPGMAAFVSFYGMFGDIDAAQLQLANLSGLLPGDALTLIGDEMARIGAQRHASLSLAFIGGGLLSIWSANAGMKALIAGLNVAYEEREKRSFLRLNLISLAFTISALIALSAAILALLSMPTLLVLLHIPPAWPLWSVARWPAMLVLATGALTCAYRFGPSRQHARWRWVTLGSAVAAALWLAVSVIFSWYVVHIARFSLTYGSLGAIIGFMMWIWLSVIVILAGAELNAELEHQTMVDSTTGAPLPMGLRGASAADSLGAARPGAWRRLAASAIARALVLKHDGIGSNRSNP